MGNTFVHCGNLMWRVAKLVVICYFCIRNTKDKYTIIDVNDWIENDDSLEVPAKEGY